MKKYKFIIPIAITATLLLSFLQITHAPVTAKTGGNNHITNRAITPTGTAIVMENDELLTPPNDFIIKAGLLYDTKKKKICWEKSCQQPLPIASLTKMMVALLTVEDIENGKIDWDTQISISGEACRMGGSKVFLRKGEVFTVKDLMKCAMIASGNDACYMLAQFGGGSEASFLNRMNRRAIELGMKNTHFNNSTGLPTRSVDNYSTAYDLLILANELLKHNDITDIAGRPQESIRHGKRNFFYKNHNKLVIQYGEEVDGLKTGFTIKAGYCIVATANRGNRRLVSVVLGAPSWATRNFFAATLMNNYYATLGLGRLGQSFQ